MTEPECLVVDVRRLDDGSYWVSHPRFPVHGYGRTEEDAMASFDLQLDRWRRGAEILRGDPT